MSAVREDQMGSHGLLLRVIARVALLRVLLSRAQTLRDG